MQKSPDKHPIENLVEDVEFKQHNTTFPDVMVNASGADELMWKGSRRITKVQRVGVGLFGLVFVLSGISFLTVFPREGWVMVIPVSTGFVVVGCKLLWNSVRKNDDQKAKHDDE
jgi:hypothetical protein